MAMRAMSRTRWPPSGQLHRSTNGRRRPFTYQAQTATGTVPVPAHRYERDVGDG
jgi:hypothetical protein